MSSTFANPTLLRRLKDILQRCFQSVFYHCLENYLAKMSKNCLCEMSYIPLYEMSFRQPCKISSRFANPTSFRRLKDILPRCLECLHKTSLRHLYDVFLPTGIWIIHYFFQIFLHQFRTSKVLKTFAKGAKKQAFSLVWESFYFKFNARFANQQSL